MTPPSDREIALCKMFESFCVTAIRNFGRNLKRAMKNRQKHDGTGEESVEYLIGLLSAEDRDNSFFIGKLLSFLPVVRQRAGLRRPLSTDLKLMWSLAMFILFVRHSTKQQKAHLFSFILTHKKNKSLCGQICSLIYKQQKANLAYFATLRGGYSLDLGWAKWAITIAQF